MFIFHSTCFISHVVDHQSPTQASEKGYIDHTKNMLTGELTPMNREVNNFNAAVNKLQRLIVENDEDLMTRVQDRI